MRRAILIAGCLAVLAAPIAARAPAAPEPAVTAAAQWQPGMGFLRSAHDACDAAHPADYGGCFVDQMARAGAPAPAVTLARRLNDRPDGLGMPGILRDFREEGAVDLAFVLFPLRANENQACLLVNGSPDLVDIDDPAHLPKAGLQRIATYARLARRYPKISLWPGTRSGVHFVQVRPRPGGGQRFIFPYVLRNGCHACATIGTVRLGFDFDATGALIGTRVVDVRATRHPRRRR